MATLDQVITRRKELRKNRRMIFVDDGAAISYYHAGYGDPITEQSFLDYQFGPHRGVANNVVADPEISDVTSFVFNTGYSGYTLHDSSIADMYIGAGLQTTPVFPVVSPGDASQAIIDNTGKDALEIAGDFFEQEGGEFFFGCRVNDRHDSSYVRSDLVPLKQGFWDNGGLLENGVNNGLDFDVSAARNLMLNTVLEVVNDPKYKINGVCLNFYRHFGTFKNVISETVLETTQTQTDIMTDWLYTITDAMNVRSQTLMDEGKEPLLLMIKVADSQEFNKQLGLDVDKWMRDGVVDILSPLGYHQFRFLKDSIAWGKKYGVCTCPSFQDPRLSNERSRNTNSGRRGRMLQILGSGSDGMEIFNYNYGKDPSNYGQSGIAWRSLTPEKLKAWGNRTYYQIWTAQSGGNIGTAGHMPKTNFYPNFYLEASSDYPWGGKGVLRIEIYESEPASVDLNIYCTGTISSLSFNGNTVSLTAETFGYSTSLTADWLVMGVNDIEVSGTEVLIEDVEVIVI